MKLVDELLNRTFSRNFTGIHYKTLNQKLETGQKFLNLRQDVSDKRTTLIFAGRSNTSRPGSIWRTANIRRLKVNTEYNLGFITDRQQRCWKVMFSQMFVYPRRGWVFLVPGTFQELGMHGPRSLHGACPWEVGMSGRGYVQLVGTHPLLPAPRA